MTQVAAICIHCGNNIPSQWEHTSFCCAGCQYVHRLIYQLDFQKFYELKQHKTTPLQNIFSMKQNFNWIDDSEQIADGRIQLQIDGLQCAACVWLIQKSVERFGNAKCSVNTTLGMLELEFDPDSFDVKEYLQMLQEFGYRTSIWTSNPVSGSNKSLMIRMVVCAAIAMNSMMLSFSFYLGLNPLQKQLYPLFGILNFILSSVSFVVGGSYFISKAIHGLRNRILHFDIPIALGIVLVYTGSTYLYFRFGAEKSFFDTLNVFITLMLLGRYLQNRMIDQNKNKILKEKTLSDMTVKRKGMSIQEIQLSEIRTGDKIYIPSGSIVPVDGMLTSGQSAEFDLSWMNGEPDPRVFASGSKIPSGSKLISQSNIELQVEKEFGYSALASLFMDVEKTDSLPRFWQQFSKYYVVIVLMLASGGFLFWYLLSGFQKALEVAVSVSVVTCPCALGIAIPLARSIANRDLMSLGVFIRHSYLLEKLSSVRKVIFDKTGTLTLANLTVSNSSEIDNLDTMNTQLIFNLVSRSQHPASQAIYQYMLGKNIRPLDFVVIENPGKGLSCTYHNDQYFLGRTQVSNQKSLYDYEVTFCKNGQEICHILLQESLQDQAKNVVEWFLQKDIDVYQISGDKKSRVMNMAQQIGIEPKNSFAECAPEAKALLIQDIDQHDTLYLGDGLNDSLAFQKSFLSGVSLGNNMNIVRHCNFFFISNGLSWLPKVFKIAKKFDRTVTFLLIFVVSYNVIVIGSALSGFIGPLSCAIIMPLSSLFVIAATTKKMNRMT